MGTDSGARVGVQLLLSQIQVRSARLCRRCLPACVQTACAHSKGGGCCAGLRQAVVAVRAGGGHVLHLLVHWPGALHRRHSACAAHPLPLPQPLPCHARLALSTARRTWWGCRTCQQVWCSAAARAGAADALHAGLRQSGRRTARARRTASRPTLPTSGGTSWSRWAPSPLPTATATSCWR